MTPAALAKRLHANGLITLTAVPLVVDQLANLLPPPAPTDTRVNEVVAEALDLAELLAGSELPAGTSPIVRSIVERALRYVTGALIPAHVRVEAGEGVEVSFGPKT